MTGQRTAYASVAFQAHTEGEFRGSVPLSDLALLPDDPAETMHSVAVIYQNALGEIKRWQEDAKSLRKSKTPLSARKAWELGDILRRLDDDLAGYGCQLENPYGHFEQHAGIPYKRVGGFVTLRRYVPDIELIPSDLKWNSIIKTVKSTGQAIAAGTMRGS